MANAQTARISQKEKSDGLYKAILLLKDEDEC